MRLSITALLLVLCAMPAVPSDVNAQHNNHFKQLVITGATVDQSVLFVTGFNLTGSRLALAGQWLTGVVINSAGTQLQAAIPELPPGSYLLTAQNGNGEKDFDRFVLTVGAIGERGVTGEKGDKGDTGEPGGAGPQGDTGPQGVKGDTGDTGDAGEKGDKGDTGANGDKGDKGDTGDQGPQGVQGFQGDPGTQGIQGPQGIAGNLALATLTCPTGHLLRGFNAQGGLVCGRSGMRTQLMHCKDPSWSSYPVSRFIPAGLDLTVVQSCDPTAETQALIVMGSGLSNIAPRAAAWRDYVAGGGIIITELMTGTASYNAVMNDGFPTLKPHGTSDGDYYPNIQFNPSDPFWVANGPFEPDTNPQRQGVGVSIAGLPGVTHLGAQFPGTVTLGYINQGLGRLWLLEVDWYDNMLSVRFDKLMEYMVGHRR